jgi:hypothetical protein
MPSRVNLFLFTNVFYSKSTPSQMNANINITPAAAASVLAETIACPVSTPVAIPQVTKRTTPPPNVLGVDTTHWLNRSFLKAKKSSSKKPKKSPKSKPSIASETPVESPLVPGIACGVAQCQDSVAQIKIADETLIAKWYVEIIIPLIEFQRFAAMHWRCRFQFDRLRRRNPHRAEPRHHPYASAEYHRQHPWS